MSQYPDFETFPDLNYARGSHKPTPPPAYLTAPPGAATASYRGLEGVLPLFPTAHPSLFQTATAGNHETQPERLLVLQETMKWVVQNQHKLLEKMETIMSNQVRVEKGLEALKTSIIKVSEDFDDWKRKVGSEVGTGHCPECEDETDRYTDAIVNDRYLP